MDFARHIMELFCIMAWTIIITLLHSVLNLVMYLRMILFTVILTVERALYYAAKLRLPSDFTKEQIKWRIDEVLEDVEMTERRSLLGKQALRRSTKACLNCSGTTG